MASPDTVTISGNVYDVYASRADCDVYFAASLSADAGWNLPAASGTTKDRALVQASRLFDVQPWQGTPTDLTTPQPLAWPRQNVVDKNGEQVPSSGAGSFPEDLLIGFCELARAIIADPSIITTTNTDDNTKRAKAGQVEVEFFRPPSSVGTISRFPQQVHEYIKQFLQGGGKLNFVSGINGESFFDENYGKERGYP